MNFTPEQLARVAAIVQANDKRFRNLVRIAELDPAADLVGADLRRVDFGSDDYDGFDFALADLRGANLAQARGLRADMFFRANYDSRTRLPDGLEGAIAAFDVERAARRIILAGQAPPVAWRQFLQKLDISAERRTWERLSPIWDKTIGGNWDVAFYRTVLLSELTNLQSLRLDYTQVEDIKPLASLIRLQELSLLNTPVHTLDAIPSLIHLQSLQLHGTRISNIHQLVSLKELKEISLSETQVSDIDALSDLTHLHTLALWSTLVSDVAPLAGLANLQRLALGNTKITDIAPLAGLANLQTLSLSNTNVTDIAPLTGLAKLQELYLDNTNVADVAPLAGLANLQILTLNNTNVADIAPLAGLANLQTLSLNNTNVADVAPLAGLANLQTLSLDNTNVTDVAALSKDVESIRWNGPKRHENIEVAIPNRKRAPRLTALLESAGTNLKDRIARWLVRTK